ncbi:MAG: hypothetical protein WC759_01465 [Candidatus Micrarchaeia archaeon]|jgi:hypothetical protein
MIFKTKLHSARDGGGSGSAGAMPQKRPLENGAHGVSVKRMLEFYSRAREAALADWRENIRGAVGKANRPMVEKLLKNEPDFFARFSEFKAYQRRIFIELALAQVVKNAASESGLQAKTPERLAEPKASLELEAQAGIQNGHGKYLVRRAVEDVDALLAQLQLGEYMEGQGKARPTGGQVPDGICFSSSQIDPAVLLSIGSEVDGEGRARGGMLAITMESRNGGMWPPALYALQHTERLKFIAVVKAYGKNGVDEIEAERTVTKGLGDIAHIISEEGRHPEIAGKIGRKEVLVFGTVYDMESGVNRVVGNLEASENGLKILKHDKPSLVNWILLGMGNALEEQCAEALGRMALKADIHAGPLGEEYRKLAAERREAEGEVLWGCMDKRFNGWKLNPDARRVVKTFGATLVWDRNEREIVEMLKDPKTTRFTIVGHESCGFAAGLKAMDGKEWDGKSDVKYMAHGHEHALEVDIVREMLDTGLLKAARQEGGGYILSVVSADPKQMAELMMRDVLQIYQENDAEIILGRKNKPLEIAAAYHGIADNSLEYLHIETFPK